MNFINHLRNRNAKDLKHPVSFGFSPSAWNESYQRLSDGSTSDKNIREFGLFLYQRLEKARESLKQLELQTPFIPVNEVIRGVVHSLNDGCLRLQQEGMEAIRDRSYITLEELGNSRTIKSSVGGEHTQQEALESIVDSARHVLRSAMKKGAGYGTLRPEEPSWEPSQSLRSALQLAQLYDGFENQWQRILWFGGEFRYSPHNQQYQLLDLNSPLSMESAVDLSRRSMKYQRDIEAVRSIQLSPETANELILYQNSANEICVRKLGELPEALQNFALTLAYQRYSLTEESSGPLLNEEHGIIKGLTIRKVYDAWMQLGFLAQQHWLDAQSYKLGSPEYSRQLTRLISKSILNTALASALRIEVFQAEQIVNYFTFNGSNVEDTLWQRPILNTKDGLLLVWHPLIAFHPMRLISVWAKEAPYLKVVHDKRGHGFEQEVVLALLAASVKSPLREKPFVLGPGIKIADKSIGDIDALLVLGSTAFVLECRNVMHPATPHEFWSASEELDAKIEQAIRKRDYLRANPSILTTLIDASPFSCLKRNIVEVVGIVVSNSYCFEGVKDIEPYFVHVDTIFNTIIYGGSLFGDIGSDGNEVSYRVNCFSQKIDAGTALARAIAKPVKAEFYRQCLMKVDFPIPAIDQDEPFGLYSTWAYTPPEIGSLRSTLERCSFARDLVVK